MTNNDLNNLLAGNDIGTIFLEIKRAETVARKMNERKE